MSVGDSLCPADGEHTSLQDDHLTDIHQLSLLTAVQSVVTVAIEVPDLTHTAVYNTTVRQQCRALGGAGGGWSWCGVELVLGGAGVGCSWGGVELV